MATNVDNTQLDTTSTPAAPRRDLTWPLILAIVVLAELISVFLRATNVSQPKTPAASISPEILHRFDLGPIAFYLTDTMLTSAIAVIVLFLFFRFATSKMSLIPGRLQNIGETLIETLLGLVEGSAGKPLGRRVFPWIATIFLFVITANWMGIIPGWETIIWHNNLGEDVALLRPANADLNMTLGMAIVAFILFQYFGIRAHGVGGKLKEYINLKNLGPLEFVSDLSRLISLSARLFGNTFGGSVLVVVMYFLLGFLSIGFLTLIFLGLELFFGLIQALLFSILTLSYIILASAGGHEHPAEDHPGPDFPLSADEKANEAAASYG